MDKKCAQKQGWGEWSGTKETNEVGDAVPVKGKVNQTQGVRVVIVLGPGKFKKVYITAAMRCQ